jgi:SAM-dependent methyltransferase
MQGDPSYDSFSALKKRGGRTASLLHDLADGCAKRGLEIGALNNPCPMPSDVIIEYVDYANTETLQQHPHEESVHRPSIVRVDHVWNGSGSLADICGRADYDFAIASHVIEHVPNVLGWFQGIYDVLKSGGIFNLAIPDRRYTFDIRRKESTLGEMVEAYLCNYSKPSIRQMFDHTFDAAAVKPGGPWLPDFNIDAIPRYSGRGALALAFDQSQRIQIEGRYFDSHCWVFTPGSFLDCIEGAIELGLFPFVFSEFRPTSVGSFEFFVSLRKEPEKTGSDLRNWQIATVQHLRGRLVAGS